MTAEAKESEPASSLSQPSSQGCIIGSSSDFKPGQKFSTPSPGNGDRVFYETLLGQRPDSEMAQDWCLSYGVLDGEAHEKLYALVVARKGKPLSPMRPSKVTSSSSSAPVPKKPKFIDDSVGDAGMGTGSAWESTGGSMVGV
jgi:hypothetical protein